MTDNLLAIIRQAGFTDFIEFHHLVSSVDLSTPEKLARFEAWKTTDGTKAGLLKLLEDTLPTDEIDVPPRSKWNATRGIIGRRGH